MKAIVALSALVAAANANMQVQLFQDGNCANQLPMERNNLEAATDCVAISAPFVTVAELNKAYKYVRQSHVQNEVLLFETVEQCQSYPTTFDKNQQVAFIRTAENGACVPCFHCGNVQSVKMTTSTTASSANVAVPAVATALLVAGAATLLL